MANLVPFAVNEATVHSHPVDLTQSLRVAIKRRYQVRISRTDNVPSDSLVQISLSQCPSMSKF